MDEKMTDLLDELASVSAMIGYATSGAERSNHKATRDKIKAEILAHLATPAQTVNTEAVREVIANLDCVGSAGSDHYSSEYLQDAINDASDKLSQAIGDKPRG